MSTDLAADRPATAPVDPPITDTPRPSGRVIVGGQDYTVERPSARKASVAFRILRGIAGTVKAVTKRLGEFEREYQAAHHLDLDRVQARMQYPPRPVLGPNGAPVLEPPFVGEGDDRQANPRAGELVLGPSPLDHMSESDWERAGHVLRLPESPDFSEKAGEVLELIKEEEEAQVYRLLALFTIPNDQVKALRKSQGLDQELDRVADDLLDDGTLDEVLELAVIAGEVVDDQFRRKAAEIGAARLGKPLRLLGFDLTAIQGKDQEAAQTSPETPQTTEDEGTSSSSSTRTSSTDSDGPSDGAPTQPSTRTMPSSSPLGNGSTGRGS